ncbi:P-loop containing nucleoside triphosphate hydrolase protein [Dactylonectria macrodidyma]|uniref:RNA helicase n=1 Tax=Dactylonectria macrodidyma TaxID=307937 RepID=A0A9P9EVY7_9HYPO|nr:P-loop containing nucleoside triphosphate hydrolase protein [Dactylonectria macrodidyma]
MRFLLRLGGARAAIHPASQRAFSTAPRLWANVKPVEEILKPVEQTLKQSLEKSLEQSLDPNVEERRQSRKESNKRSSSSVPSRAKSVSKGHDPTSRLRLDTKKKYTGRHAVFRSTVLSRFQAVLARISTSEVSMSGVGEDELNRQASLFMDVLDQAFLMAEQNITRRDKNPLFWNLRDAFILKDLKGLSNEIQYSFQSFLIRQRFSKGLEESHKRLLDFRFPHEWFPATRALQRTIHVHVGPTNSGKTYRALKALENSKRGVYAGPLRLLANEVYQRLTAKGVPCALITGEEVRIPDHTDQYFSSCTVEMTPLNERFDVAVIDEIQMIGDPDRGTAWTTALLGVQAKEVHVCGEERTVKLIQSLCASIGDECIVHRYERLSPLEAMDTALDGDFNQLEKGDAIVAFSRLNLHTLKRAIEKHTGRRCAIIYGSLPPEVRVQQAALFNDPDNDYDFVVASDAIGMGLNLEIRRVILESVTKYDGSQNRMLTFPELKQIGGRAGRYRTARNATEFIPDADIEEQKVGYVTAMDRADLRTIHRAFDSPVDDLKIAYISPPAVAIERFASYFPKDTPLSFILMRIRELAMIGENYALGIPVETLEIADAIQDIPLSIYDRLTLCHVPVTVRAEKSLETLRALASIIANNENGDLLKIQAIPLEFLDLQQSNFKGTPQQFLYKLESLHVALNQYVWLSYRYEGMFRDQALAFHIRSLVEQRLIETLETLDFTDEDLEYQRQSKRLRAHSLEQTKTALGVEDPEYEEASDKAAVAPSG